MNNSARQVVIAGAGITGSLQALLLSRAGFAVTLIDEGNGDLLQGDGLNVRSVALSYRSQQLLADQCLWPENSGCSIDTVHVTERGKFGAVRLQARDLDVPSLGVVVPNNLLESQLMAEVKADPAIRLIQPATVSVETSTVESVSLQVHTRDESFPLSADLLIAADGTHSSIRESLGIETRVVDYKQHAVVANLQCQRDHQHTAFERFTDTGPMALLPLAEKQVAMVLTTDSSQHQQLVSLSDEEILRFIQLRFGGRLGRFTAIGQRAAFPLALVETRAQAQDRIVFVGNSARTLHPVAGQGLNLAIRDIFDLSAGLVDSADIGMSLTDFVKSRSPDQRLVVRQTDLLARLFKQQPWPVSVPLSLFRTTAMLLLDTTPPMRSAFGALTSGLNVPLRNFVANELSDSKIRESGP